MVTDAAVTAASLVLGTTVKKENIHLPCTAASWLLFNIYCSTWHTVLTEKRIRGSESYTCRMHIAIFVVIRVKSAWCTFCSCVNIPGFHVKFWECLMGRSLVSADSAGFHPANSLWQKLSFFQITPLCCHFCQRVLDERSLCWLYN